jgi:outer membrane protein TolC
MKECPMRRLFQSNDGVGARRGAPCGRGALALIALGALAGRATAGPAAATADQPLALGAAVKAALATNERAGIARADRDAAAAGVDRAHAALLPSVVATGTYTRRSHEVTRDLGGGSTAVIQSLDALSGNVTASMSVVDLRAWPLLRQARLTRDAAAADEHQVRRQLAFDVATAFLAVLGQEEVLQAAERRRDFAVASLTVAQGRAGAGIASGNDVTRARVEQASAERDAIDARAALEVARAELGYLIGRPVDGPLAAPRTLFARAEAPPPDGAAIADAARTKRPDLVAARLRAGAARAYADEPARRVWPVLGVAGQVRGTNETGLAGRTYDWSVALTATWTLWDGGARKADARDRDAQAQAQTLTAQADERRIATDVAQALARLRGAQAALVQAQAAADAAGKNADEVASLFHQGLTNALTVADAGTQRFSAEVALASARFEVASAWLQLAAAGGVDPTTEPLW